MSAKEKPSENTMNFSADVARLLEIVAHALYTNHDVFLRELISNASDACDRLRYEAISKPELTKDNPEFVIHIYRDEGTRTLTIVDNGIGMSKKELIDNLGTIAKSGTKALMEKMKSKGDPLKLIGQFGVGFYASYMVASYVSVTSRKAGMKEAHTWGSDGASGFTVEKATSEETAKLIEDRGTAITLQIKDEGSDFLTLQKIEETVKQYSDHIDVPIYLVRPDDRNEADRPVNQASAIWTRPKKDITKEQYTEFYKHITHGFDEPLMTSHWQAEGVIEFSALLFIPTMRPWDLYDPGRKGSLKLYVRRVFIGENIEGLSYPWLRFVRGVIDSSDLPLNISRESLQYNPVITKIRSAVTKRVLSDLEKLSREDVPGFAAFWGQFGAALKEGLYDAVEHREAIFKVCRFYSTHDNGDKFTSLDEYVERMKDSQDEIYYITGENIENLKNSPQIEGFKSRGIEVLFMTDTVDDFWLQQVSDYKGKTFKSVTKGDIDLGKFKKDTADKSEEKDAEENDYSALLTAMKEALKEDVEDVRLSKRLTDSAVCLVASSVGVDMHMERVLKLQQQYRPTTKPVLEINGDHPLIKKLSQSPAQDSFELLLDQARIIQGEPVKNPTAFARRMAELMEKGL